MSLTSAWQAATITATDGPKNQSSTGNGASFDTKPYKGGLCFVLTSSAGTGTTPTMDVKIQHSSDNAAWSDVSGATFTQVTDASSLTEKLTLSTANVDRYVRFRFVLGGTTPSYSLAAIVISQKEIV